MDSAGNKEARAASKEAAVDSSDSEVVAKGEADFSVSNQDVVRPNEDNDGLDFQRAGRVQPWDTL